MRHALSCTPPPIRLINGTDELLSRSFRAKTGACTAQTRDINAHDCKPKFSRWRMPELNPISKIGQPRKRTRKQTKLAHVPRIIAHPRSCVMHYHSRISEAARTDTTHTLEIQFRHGVGSHKSLRIHTRTACEPRAGSNTECDNGNPPGAVTPQKVCTESILERRFWNRARARIAHHRAYSQRKGLHVCW